MFYRLRRNLNYFRFHHQIRRLLDTPPVQIRPSHLNIVSMVAEYDVKLYILAIKALYRRLGHGKITIVSDRVAPAGLELIRRHVPGIEVVPIESIETGGIQKGGTWERLLFCLDRSASSFVLQMDADVLCVGPMPEVVESIDANRAFTLADGIPKKPLDCWVEDAIARHSNNIVFDFEKQAPKFPESSSRMYLRGSSGFAGFARGAVDRAFVKEFYDQSLALMGPRWKEWGTEQIASNYCVANSPGSFGLPKPKYLTWERHQLPEDLSLLHFLGYCRFDQGVFARFANLEIDALLSKA